MKSMKSILLPYAMVMATLRSDIGSTNAQHLTVKVDPSWKRKKCKSCRDCGSYCYPTGRYSKYSKPTDSACKDYKAKKK